VLAYAVARGELYGVHEASNAPIISHRFWFTFQQTIPTAAAGSNRALPGPLPPT
jgi:hypothetical protein